MTDKAYLIYLEDKLLLSKKEYHDWREIQDEYYKTYKTSLSPMTCDELIRFFEDDDGEESCWPFSKEELIEFFKSQDKILSSNR